MSNDFDFRDEFFSDEEEEVDPFGEEFGDFDFGADADLPEFGELEDDEGGGGGRRTIFGMRPPLFFALLLGAIFLIVVVVVLLLSIANRGPNAVQLTSTAVVATNDFITQTVIPQTETQNAINFATGTQAALDNIATSTQEAIAFAATSTAEAAVTDTPIPSPTPEVTATNLTILVTPTPADGAADGSGGGTTDDELSLTATALADILGGGTGGIDTPTPDNATGATAIAGGATTAPGGFVTPTPSSGLPNTGFFDEIAGGGGVNGLLLAGLAALGLGAVILVARALRTNNGRKP